jgi:hypothetical protein
MLCLVVAVHELARVERCITGSDHRVTGSHAHSQSVIMKLRVSVDMCKSMMIGTRAEVGCLACTTHFHLYRMCCYQSCDIHVVWT